jgi:hypothetical protein
MKIHFKQKHTFSESFKRFDYEKLTKVEVWGNELSIQEFSDLDELNENIEFYRKSEDFIFCFEVEFNEHLAKFDETYKKATL